MDEIAVAKKDSAQATDQTSKGDKETTPKTPQTYTEAQAKKLVSDSLAEQGRKHKAELEPIVKERDGFKSQAEQAKVQVEEATAASEETKATIVQLEADLETLGEGNVDAAEVIKVKKELRTERTKLAQEVKAEKDALAELKKVAEKERLDNAELVSWAQSKKFDEDIALIVDEYEGDVGTNFDKLKTTCEKAGIKTKEGAEGLADAIWVKKAKSEDNEPAIIDDSGVTSGGSGWDPDKHTPRENIARGLKTKK